MKLQSDGAKTFAWPRRLNSSRVYLLKDDGGNFG